jgi:ABC-type transporter Mla subunit MlaD
MAPHDTNTPKEGRRHAAPLIGMALVVLFGVGLIFWWVVEVTQGPEEAPNNPVEAPAAEPASPATAPNN